MELRQLRYFVAVAETGNISQAAKAIFLTQPALSRQIKALEDEIGHCLLERRAHSIHLTAAGETLLREARELFQAVDQLLERVRAAGTGVHLRVGYSPSFASGILSAAVANFTQAHSGAQVELFDLSTNELLTGLDSKKLDIVLTVGGDTARRGITWTPLLRAPWRLVVKRGHPLAGRPRVTPAEAAREPLLIFCKRDYPEYWSSINGWFREHGLRPKIGGEYDSSETLMAAVEAGLGVAIVTTRTALLFRHRARIKMLSAEPPPLCIVAGSRTDSADPKPLAVFVEDLRTAARAFS